MKIFTLSAPELITYYFDQSKKSKTLAMVFCNSRMEDSLKEMFPNIKVIKLLPIHLSQKKIQIQSTLVKNIFKIIYNYLKIFYFIYKKKSEVDEVYYSHTFCLETNQVLKVCKILNIKLIYIPTYNYKNDIEIQYSNFIKKIYQKLFMNKLIISKNKRFDKDNVKFDLIPDRIINSKNKKLKNNLKKIIFYENNAIKIYKKKIAIIIDADLISLENLYGKIDFKETKKNLNKYYRNYLSKYDYLLFKKRIEKYQKKEIYLYDLLNRNPKFILIKRYIPAEYVISLSKNIYSVFSYNVKGPNIHRMNNLIKFVKPTRWVKENLL